jgi:hypothetical protein
LVIILSPIKAENLGLTLILAACLLCPAAFGDGGPLRVVGSGPENWWIEYPYQHLNAGSAVGHPSWALDALKERPVIMLIHKNGCHTCARQEAEIRKILGGLGDDVTYADVLFENDWEKGWKALEVYDPGGDPALVPVTVFLTLAPAPDGNATIAWHSVVGYRSEGWIISYLNDAIALHHDNSAGWER